MTMTNEVIEASIAGREDSRPPENVLVICVDEKSQCQALERTQPTLPMGFGYVAGVTHDYKRHGTTTLFAALNVLHDAVLTSCKPRHRRERPAVPPCLTRTGA